MHNVIDLIQHEKRCKLLYTKLIARASKDFDLTQNECDVLLFIHNNPTFNTATDIVNNRLIAKSNVSTAVESLKKRGLLSTQADSCNRRIVRIFLLPESKLVLKKLTKAQKDFENIFTRDISKEDIEFFIKLIEKNQANVISALADIEKDG